MITLSIGLPTAYVAGTVGLVLSVSGNMGLMDPLEGLQLFNSFNTPSTSSSSPNSLFIPILPQATA